MAPGPGNGKKVDLTARETTFAKVYQNGRPPPGQLYWIVQYPPEGQGNWKLKHETGKVGYYILYCSLPEHGRHFIGPNALRQAAKHTLTPSHGKTGFYKDAIEEFGICVVDCDASKARLNNEMVVARMGKGTPRTISKKRISRHARLKKHKHQERSSKGGRNVVVADESENEDDDEDDEDYDDDDGASHSHDSIHAATVNNRGRDTQVGDYENRSSRRNPPPTFDPALEASTGSSSESPVDDVDMDDVYTDDPSLPFELLLYKPGSPVI
ncbi:hypothetical protein B0T16DRAFT_407761 [Cercophora newfieldiana]|uniref:Uncharacterized protein n=1 Tax=Cercophora newfieldiana TaxID=92897 RepID=A0AA39YA21_9PEZI|nr:hypothetical protein B0T16DRAFT_407761 [Cercophora newfieldiana]